MFFRKMRQQVKFVVIIVSITFVGGLLYAGGTAFFGGDQRQGVQVPPVATVSGRPISRSDFHQAYLAQLQQTEQQTGRVTGRMSEAVKNQTLESLVGQLLVQDEIDRRSIRVPASEVNERFNELKDQFPSDDVFRQQLQMSGLTEAQLKSYLEQDLQVEKLRDQVAGVVEISADDVARAYEQVESSHILIRPKGDDEEAWERAEAEAQAVMEVLDDHEFGYLAQIYSEDRGSAEKDGSIGFVGRGRTVPEYEEVIFSADVGEVHGPVRSQFGYHIIKVTDVRSAEGEQFEAEREEIEARLREERKQEAVSQWFQDLKDAADVVIKDHQILAHRAVLDGDLEEAVHYYELALEDTPQDGYLYASLGDALLQLDRREEAMAQYEEATERITNDAQLFFTLGEIYQQADREDDAVEKYLRASELAPNDFMMQLQVINVLSALGRDEEEINLVDERITAIQERQMEQQRMQAELEKMLQDAESGAVPSDGEETELDAGASYDAAETVETE